MAKNYEDRAFQWSDLSDQGKEIVSEQMGEWGKAKSSIPRITSKLESSIEKAQSVIDDPNTPSRKVESSARTLKKGEASLRNIEAASEHLKDRNVTLTTAANARVSLARDSAKRAEREAALGLGGGSRLRAAGAGWYFDHRADLNKTASSYGIDEDLVVTASAVMSPQNSPSNEKAAVEGLAHLHSTDPLLTLSSKAQRALKLKSRTVNFSQLTSKQASLLGSPDLRKHIKGVSSDILEKVARGGTNENIEKGIDVLRGHIKPDDAINQFSAPKVWSYRDSIRKADPSNTAVREEYLTRADNALFQIPGQTRLDLFGLKDSTEGILSPTKTTAEDTWQGAISSKQKLESVEVPGSKPISPAKFWASEKTVSDEITKTKTIDGKRVSATPDPRIGPTALIHAFHNEATIRAAKMMSTKSGEIVPSVLAQESPWTESRRQAEKDPDYSKLNLNQFREGYQPNPLKGQMKMF